MNYMVHPYDGILLINKKKNQQTAGTPSIIDDSQKHYAKLKRDSKV